MKRPVGRRTMSIGALVALALGSGGVALAAGGASDDESDSEFSVVALAPADDELEVDDAEADSSEADDSDNASAFSEWVHSLDHWGCIRGALVSQAAGDDHRGDDFAGPSYATPEEAADALGLADRRCAQIAIAKAAADDGGDPDDGEDNDDGEGEDDGEGNGNGHVKHGDGHGPPPHAKGNGTGHAKHHASDGNDD